MKIKHKVIEWIARYGPSEVIGTITALIAASLTLFFTNNGVAAAFAGTWGENAGYYGSMLYRDSKKDHEHHKNKGERYGTTGFAKTLRNLVIEFGPAEILDSFIIRPFCMFVFPLMIKNFHVGILIGKIVADIIFYIPTTIAYELRKKHMDN